MRNELQAVPKETTERKKYQVMVQDERFPKAVLYSKGHWEHSAKAVADKLNMFKGLHAWVELQR